MIKSARFQKCRPHRLGAQDATLSRSKPGFESPWGHKSSKPPTDHVERFLFILRLIQGKSECFGHSIAPEVNKIDVERFLSMLRFDSREKGNTLGVMPISKRAKPIQIYHSSGHVATCRYCLHSSVVRERVTRCLASAIRSSILSK